MKQALFFLTGITKENRGGGAIKQIMLDAAGSSRFVSASKTPPTKGNPSLDIPLCGTGLTAKLSLHPLERSLDRTLHVMTVFWVEFFRSNQLLFYAVLMILLYGISSLDNHFNLERLMNSCLFRRTLNKINTLLDTVSSSLWEKHKCVG